MKPRAIREGANTAVPRAQWPARIGTLLLSALGVFLLVALFSYTSTDLPFLSSHPNDPALNWGGTVGAWVGFAGRGVFGWASLFLPGLALLWAIRVWRGALAELHTVPFMLSLLSLVASGATLLALCGPSEQARVWLGGMGGFVLARAGTYYLGAVGTILTAVCIGSLAWIIVSGQTLRATWAVVSAGLAGLINTLLRRHTSALTPSAGGAVAVEPAAPPRMRELRTDAPEMVNGANTPVRVRVRSTIEPKPKTIPSMPRRQSSGGFQLPSLDLLSDPPPLAQRQITEDLQTNARILEETLREFGIEATVVNIDRGPSVTRYELTPAPGVKLTKIMALSDDLALVMKAASCHVIAPLPGKGTVGIDVPNSMCTTVYLKEIITAHEFASHPSPIVLPIGKDVSGKAIVTDLRECPHLLVAGATGSGKTVCLNSLLIGIMTHASPEQVKFMMIDPKMVEMAMFNEIPHLLAPVVTSPKKAALALHWAVQEMERRYQVLAKVGVRNIDMYNKRALAGEIKPETPAIADNGEVAEGPVIDGRPLPYLVIVVDELADLMMSAPRDVETAITRLAQLSRAVGLHMILATQRPSVDVITGVIKANFPARIAFQVASKVDSRTILDINGADKLLGRGDLMFLRPGTAKPIRAQGAFVTDQEIEQVTAYLKQQQPPTYDTSFLEKAERPEGVIEMERDEMYEQARQLVLDTGQASTSLLQRRLRLGYGRAARILDLMEQEGIVGPSQGSRPREVLIQRGAS